MSIHKPKNSMCKECQLGKMMKPKISSTLHTSNDILELVHTDLYGPMRVESYYGDIYFILFVDDYTRMLTIILMKVKSHSSNMFK